MRIGGGVLGRGVGAALLAGLFIAAAVAHGQTLATIQTAENLEEADPSSGPTPALARDAELPSAPTPAIPLDQSAPYTPITPHERVVWIVKGTLWPEHLLFGAMRTGVATGLDEPEEDGPHWGGFAERFGIRLTGVATSKVMEASVGSLWGEDPRYFRVPEESFGDRVKNVIKMTFFSRRADGKVAPAYARYIAFSGSNFLSNEWRPDSEANTDDAVRRTFEGFAGHMAGNAWNEFWPDAKRYIFHRGRQP
jgi:hypothetical protein